VWFRRQVVIGRFIVEFLAHAPAFGRGSVGGYHATRVGADARRDGKLKRLGYRVLRLDADVIRPSVNAQSSRSASRWLAGDWKARP